MRRGMLLCVVIGAATAILGISGPALAGGGCHAGATQTDESGESEATVRMIDACFTASVTKVDPGTVVTFVNADQGLTHNVGGNEWGHFEDMTKGDAFTAAFADPGIYPFACSYHPGMTGAIVVGDGIGAGTGWTVSVEPFEHAPKAIAPVATPGRGISLGALVAVGLGGLALGAAVVLAFRRQGAA